MFLPEEIWLAILSRSFSNVKEFMCLAQTCSLFRRLCLDFSLPIEAEYSKLPPYLAHVTNYVKLEGEKSLSLTLHNKVRKIYVKEAKVDLFSGNLDELILDGGATVNSSRVLKIERLFVRNQSFVKGYFDAKQVTLLNSSSSNLTCLNYDVEKLVGCDTFLPVLEFPKLVHLEGFVIIEKNLDLMPKLQVVRKCDQLGSCERKVSYVKVTSRAGSTLVLFDDLCNNLQNHETMLFLDTIERENLPFINLGDEYCIERRIRHERGEQVMTWLEK